MSLIFQGIIRYTENLKRRKQFLKVSSFGKITIAIMSAVKFTFFLLFCCIPLSGCALQQDVNSLANHTRALSQRDDKLEQRLIELERQLSALKQQNAEIESLSRVLQEKSSRVESKIENTQKIQAENDKKLREQFAGLRVMLAEVRQEVQAITGKSEMAEHLLKQKTKTVESLERKIENRLSSLEEKLDEDSVQYKNRFAKLEQYLNFEASAQKDLREPAESKPAEELSDIELYSQAKGAFDKGEFETARAGFQALLEKYPNSNNADNAQFWIGETYYREKWYEKAILEYQKVIEKYPKGNKMPASLLKQGLAFFNIGDKANARLILRELTNKYPKANEANIARKKLEEIN